MATESLLELAHSLSKFVVGAEGNVSCRTPYGFKIKASGKSLALLSKGDLINCNSEGDKTNSGPENPSIETSFHSWLYSFTHVNFVAHTHPINALKILCCGDMAEDFANFRIFPDQVVYNGRVSCLVPYAHPGKALLEAIKTSFKSYEARHGGFPKLILLKNHGIICAGATAKECLIATEICEKAAEVFLSAYHMGMINRLDHNDISLILDDPKERYRSNQ